MPVSDQQSTGFQAGARRTLPLDMTEAWELITSPRGVEAWLGAGAPPMADGADGALADGTTIEMKAFTEGSHLRLSVQPAAWARPSLVQVRILPAPDDHAVISFHQENLPNAASRTERMQWYKGALDRLEALAYGR